MFFINWLKKLKKDRTLQVDIVTLFIFLFFTSSTINILYTYKKNYDSIIEFSSSTIYRTGTIILQKIENLIRSCEKTPFYINEIILKNEILSLQDEQINAYLQTVLKSEPDFTGLFVGETDGTFLSMANLHKTQQKTFATEPERALPPEAFFSIEEINKKSTIPSHSYRYVDKHFNTVANEKTQGIDYDPRTRPWYIGAEKSKGLFWTKIYTFYPTFEPGISVSLPFYDPQGQLLGVSGVDLSLLTISDFIKTQKIGKSGMTVIMDKDTGKILMPVEWEKDTKTSTSSYVLEKAFHLYMENNTESTTFDINGVTYLAGFRRFPLSEDSSWVVVMAAPLSDFFSGLLQTQKEVVLISILIFIVSVIFIIVFSRRISKPISTLALEIDKIKNLELTSSLRVQSNIREINILDSSIAAMRSAVISFTKYVPKEIVKPLIEQGKTITLGGEKKEIAILFTDIVGFTQIADSLSVEILTKLLEEYFDKLSRIIIGQKGTIDKYIGDSIMAFWGAPLDMEEPWSKACLTALLCQFHLKELNAARKQKDLPLFLTKIGIDTGSAFIGNIGTEERINYTAIGDAINTASRLQGLNNVYHTGILISERVQKHLKGQFLLRPIDSAYVKGKKDKINVFEIMASIGLEKETEATKEQITLCQLYTSAYDKYEQGNLSSALAEFKNIASLYPEDMPTRYMTEKIQEKILKGN